MKEKAFRATRRGVHANPKQTVCLKNRKRKLQQKIVAVIFTASYPNLLSCMDIPNHQFLQFLLGILNSDMPSRAMTPLVRKYI